MQRFIAKAKGSEVHRNHRLGPELTKGLESLLGIHMNVAFSRRLIGSDGQEGDFDVRACANFPEAVEVSGVAAMEDCSAGVFEEKASESPVAVVEDACAPMACGSEGNFERAMLKALPMAQFVNPVESQIMHEIADVFGHGDGLVAGYGAQRAAIQMIEVSMGDQHEIDGRKVAELDPGMLDALNDLEPFRPIGIDEHAVLGSLNEKGGVSDPSDANLAGRKFGKDRLDLVSLTFRKEGRNNDFRKKISFMPPIAKAHVHVVLRFCALSSF